MSGPESGAGPNERDGGSWANESLPLSVRKELLERELSKLGFRKAAARGNPQPHDNASAQHHQAEASASHPQADSQANGQHGD